MTRWVLDGSHFTSLAMGSTGAGGDGGGTVGIAQRAVGLGLWMFFWRILDVKHPVFFCNPGYKTKTSWETFVLVSSHFFQNSWETNDRIQVSLQCWFVPDLSLLCHSSGRSRAGFLFVIQCVDMNILRKEHVFFFGFQAATESPTAGNSLQQLAWCGSG